jgi:hypothetical protein
MPTSPQPTNPSVTKLINDGIDLFNYLESYNLPETLRSFQCEAYSLYGDFITCHPFEKASNLYMYLEACESILETVELNRRFFQ